MKKNLAVALIAFGVWVTGCGKNSDDTADQSELAQQIGDSMASVDESSGSSTGNISLFEQKAADRLFARLLPYSSQKLFSTAFDYAVPSAQAVSCLLTPGFGACSSNMIVRDFSNCTIGNSSLSGTTTLTWGGGAANCLITGDGQTITRVPAFTISGRYGGLLSVSKSGTIGQRVTRISATTYRLTSDGIRRVVTIDGATAYDFTTQTVGGAGLLVTGTNRAGRTLTTDDASVLRITYNRSGVTCDVVPTAVTWTANCNCATSGSWSGSCSDGKSATITLSGCGSASLVLSGTTIPIIFDRCYGT